MQTVTSRFIILFLIILGIVAAGSGIYAAVGIKLTGVWFETIDASDLQAGAGSNLIDTYESLSDQTSIEIIGAAGKNWRVDVKKTDTNWHSNFELSVRRTSDGTGPGTISGGTSYQEVTDTDKTFFDGSESRIDIYEQLKLSGVSVQVPWDTYVTTIYYTVVEP
jgi:hypothetical protein